MFQDTQWFVPGSYGGEGGVYFTDWWSSPDHSRYFPTRPPQQVSVTYRYSERLREANKVHEISQPSSSIGVIYSIDIK